MTPTFQEDHLPAGGYTSLAQIHEWTHRNFLKRAELVPDRRCRIVLAPAEDLPFLEAITKAYRAGFVEPLLVGNQRAHFADC